MMIEWGSVAGWVSGIGSMAAAIVALYIAHSARRIKLHGYCGHRQIVQRGEPPVDVFSVSVTNVSQRSTVVTGIGCTFGIWRWKQHGMILFMQDQYSQGIPKSLVDGETGNWNVPLGQDNQWLRDIASKYRLDRWAIYTWRVQIYTSNGGITMLRPDKGIRSMLAKTAGLGNAVNR